MAYEACGFSQGSYTGCGATCDVVGSEMAVLATCDSGQTLVVELLDATVDGGTREARTFATLEFACPIASIKPAVVFRVSGDVARIGQPVQVLIKGTVEGNVRLMLQTTNTATR